MRLQANGLIGALGEDHDQHVLRDRRRWLPLPRGDSHSELAAEGGKARDESSVNKFTFHLKCVCVCVCVCCVFICMCVYKDTHTHSLSLTHVLP